MGVLMSDLVEIASLDAETLILGRMINDAQDRKSCCEALDRQHFFYAEHKLLFNVLSRFQEQNHPSEISLLLEVLKNEGILEKAKGAEYLVNLSQAAPLSIHLPSYITILKHNWAKREALEEVKKFSHEISKTQDIPSFLETFSKRFATLLCVSLC